MKTKDKFFTLLKEGFTLKTLRKMNESQLNVLYKKVVKEQSTTEKITAAAAASKEITANLEKASEMLETDELTEDWGSSDQNIMNASIHRDLGEPEEMPSPFSPELESAAESAVDFYWDDWEEYQTDRQGLIDNAKRIYLRRYFPEKFNMLVRMFEPAIERDPYDVKIDGELDEADIDNIKPFKGQQTQDPKQVGPSTDDGMGNYQDGMGIDEGKKKTSKMKTPIATLGMFEGKKKKKEKYNPWAVCTSSLGLEGKKEEDRTKKEKEKFERCVRDVKKQNESFEKGVRQIEESIVSLLKNYKKPTMTKKDLLEQGTKEAPVKTPVKTPSKPDRKTPYEPKHRPAPKAGDTKTAPVRTKPGTKEKPGKSTPYQPKHRPAPKAGETKEIPSFLKFDNLNITFRDE